MAQDEQKSEQGFRFRAQIFDTANTYAITYYIMSVEIFGFDLPEYVLAKRYSDFFEFHRRLSARFHHKRLPKIPSKTFVKTHDDEFITQRKNALNKYLQGVCERLYLQNALAVWDFFELTEKVNPYLHRYKVLHLSTLQCNDYRNVPPPSHAPPKPPKQEELPPPPSPDMNNDNNNVPYQDADDLIVPNDGFFSNGTPDPDQSNESITSRTLAKTATFFGNLWTNIKEKSKEIQDRKGKAKREWTVIYGTFLDLNTYLTVSTIHADNTRSNWWDQMLENVFENQIDEQSDNENNKSNQTSKENINANNRTTPDAPNLSDENNQLLAQRVEDDKDEKDSVNSLQTIGLDIPAQKRISQTDPLPKQAQDLEQPRVSGHETTSLRMNEFYLGKAQLWHWTPNNEIRPKHSENATEYMIRPLTTFPMVRNRPKCAAFDPDQLLLALGTSKGKILLLRVNEQTMKFEMIDWLPHMFGSHVNGMIIVPSQRVFYKPNVITEAIQNSRLPEGSDTIKKSNITGYLYAVSNDCHLSVFDLSRGNCIGHIQTGITGNLGLSFCFERIFVCNRDNHIISLIRSSNQGTPVPEIDLYGHSKTVTCLLSDEPRNRMFSGGSDNSIGVWYYDRIADRLIQTQHLKAVNKSRGFTSLAIMNNIHCLAAGADNGFITIWYEGPLKSVYERSSKYSIGKDQNGNNNNNNVNNNNNSSGLIDIPTERNENGKKLKVPVFNQNNLKNGAVWSNLSKDNKSWKCLYTWRAHKTEVTSLEYLREYNVLMSCGADGTVRMVYLCNPSEIPPMQFSNDKMIKYRIGMRDDMKRLYGISPVPTGINSPSAVMAATGNNENINDEFDKEIKENNEEEKMDREPATGDGGIHGEKLIEDQNIIGNIDDPQTSSLKEIEFVRNVTIELFEKKLIPYFEDVTAIDKTQYINVKEDMLRKQAETGNQWYNLIGK